MKEVDDIILDCISENFKSAKMISEETNLPYVRVQVRLRQMRKRGVIVFMLSNESHVKGVKPLKYKKKEGY